MEEDDNINIGEYIQSKFDSGELNQETVNDVAVDIIEYFYERIESLDGEQEDVFYLVVISSLVSHILYEIILQEVDGISASKDDVDNLAVNYINYFLQIINPMLRHTLATDFFKSDEEKKSMN
jgi:hypothetical protein